jgi:hypothetical protein
MFADIATGHHAAADVCFLIAAILAGIAALLSVRPVRAQEGYVWAPVAAWASVALLAVAWLIL